MLKFKALKPLLNRVLIEKVKPVNKTKSGLLLERQNIMNIGLVKSVGEGIFQNGVKIPMPLKEGQKVMLPEYGGSAFKLADGKEYCIYRDDDILGVLEEEVV